MALRKIESFDHYSSGYLGSKWNYSASGTVTTTGRLGGSYFSMPKGGGLGQTIDSQSTWIVGFAINWSGLINGRRFFVLRDSGGEQLDLRVLTGANTIYLTRNGTTLATGSTPIVGGVWYFYEVKAVIDNTVGSFTLKINGLTELTFSGDTQNTANASANQILWTPDYSLGGDNGNTYGLDDIYICDGTGGAPTNDFLGDSRVECLFPNGNGNSSQLVGSDGNSVDNYLLVDEASPNDDTDYVQSNVVGNEDTYAYGDLASTSGTVYGVQLVPRFRKTNAGSRVAVSVARLSGTEVDSADKMVLDSYQYVPDIRETKPGGGAWTISDVNNAEFGIKVKA